MIEQLLEFQHQNIQKALNSGILGYTTTGTVTEEKYGTLSTRYSQIIPNKVRVEVDLPSGVIYVEGYNGAKAWEFDKYVDGRAEEAMRHCAEWPSPIKSFITFQERGNDVKFIREEYRKGSKYAIFELVQKGFRREYWIDSNSGLPHFARDARPLHPKDDWKLIETRFEKYQDIEGLMVPMRVVDHDLESKQDLMIVEIEKVEVIQSNHKIAFDKNQTYD